MVDNGDEKECQERYYSHDRISGDRVNYPYQVVCVCVVSISDLAGGLGAKDSIVFEPQVTGCLLNRGGKGCALVSPPTWLSWLADNGGNLCEPSTDGSVQWKMDSELVK